MPTQTPMGHRSQACGPAGGPPQTLQYIPLSEIRSGPAQPRKSFSDDELEKLAQSIRNYGVLQPILVYPKSQGHYRIIAGERRWRAAHLAGLQEIPCIIQESGTDHDLEVALIENIQRQELSPIEEALALKTLMQERHYTQQQLSSKIGLPRATITNTLRLLQLPDLCQQAIHERKLTSGHGKVLLGVSSEMRQLEITELIITRGLSVRATEDLAREPSGEKATNPLLPRQAVPQSLRRLCDQFKGHLGTKVKISGDDHRGRIEISYYCQEDLDRIAELVLGDIR
jgi:ParB family chromosome partitioning protein